MVPILAAFSFDALLVALIWGVWVVLNLWIWQKSKATSSLLMMVGAGLQAAVTLMVMVGAGLGAYVTLSLIGLVALTAGFYLSVKPMVAAQIAALQAKAKNIGHHNEGGTGVPPPTSPAPKP